VEENLKQIVCSKCGAINNIKIEKLEQFPICGRCKEKLISDIKDSFDIEEVFSQVDFLDELFKEVLSFYRKYWGEENYLNFNKRLDELKKNKSELSYFQPITLVVAGEYSSGKSSVINSIIGEDLIPVGAEPMTLAPSIFRYSYEKKILLQFNDDTIKEISSEDFKRIKHTNKDLLDEHKNIKLIRFYYPYPKLALINIIDTPGFSTSTAQCDDEKTMEIVRNSDLILWVFNANHGTAKKSEIDLLEKIKKFFDDDRSNHTKELLEKNIVKNNNKFIGLLNYADVKGEPESFEIKEIIKEIKKATFLEDIIPYSATEILEYRKKDIEGQISHIINKRIFNGNNGNSNVSINTKIDKLGNKKIIVDNGIENIFEEHIDDVWIKSLYKLESKFDYFRNHSKDILTLSILHDVNNLLKETDGEFCTIINSVKNFHQESIDAFSLAKVEIENISSNIKDKFDTYEKKFERKLSSFLPDMIFNIILNEGWFSNSKKLELKGGINFDKIFEKVYSSFDYENIINNDVKIIGDIFENIKNNLNFNEELSKESDEIFSIYDEKFSNIIKTLSYISRSMINMGVNISLSIATNMAEKYKETELNSDISNSYYKDLFFKELYSYSDMSTIFHWCYIAVKGYYDDLISFLDNIINIYKETSENHINVLSGIRNEILEVF